MKRPATTLGMRHIALNVRDIEACEHFYVDLVGMAVDWRPDADSLYLSSGHDNLALHRTTEGSAAEGAQHLDHFGFFIASAEQVDEWHDFLKQQDVPMKTSPKTHRDGARSFYCLDPEGVVVQFIYYPPIKSNGE